MPELEARLFAECTTFAEFSFQMQSHSDPKVKYTVQYGNLSFATGGNNHAAEHGWTCSCPSFRNNNCPVKGAIGVRECKHISDAKKLRCGWCQFIEEIEPIEENGVKKCPKCKGAITYRRWAV